MSSSLSRYGRVLLLPLLVAGSLILPNLSRPAIADVERRNDIAHPRTPYQFSFYKRHRRSYRVAGSLHFAHSKLHDVLLLTPFANSAKEDAKLYGEVLKMYNQPPNIEPTMEMFAPYAARATWRLFRTIDGVHLLHEMTQDIMSDADIPWDQKDEELKKIYKVYRDRYSKVALSPAPLDVTMRRAAVMMKPYFSLTRNYYPKNNNFFYAAHWWHPTVYESLMLGGNGKGQDLLMNAMEDRFRDQVISKPPQRMLLSREGTPRYSRLSPETANVFDNLHMLHGITYDIFAYDGWTVEQKRAELYRVLDAMAYKPGDEKLVRKFKTPRPDLNPLSYDDWVTSNQGSMTTMMLEMLDEMMAVHGSGSHGDHGGRGSHSKMGHGSHGDGHSEMDHGDRGDGHQMEHGGDRGGMNHGESGGDAMKRLRHQLTLKLTPGIQEGEIAGSFADAMKQIMPEMAMPGMDEPGTVSPLMVKAMLDGWYQKYGDLPDIAPFAMDREPTEADVRSLVEAAN